MAWWKLVPWIKTYHFMCTCAVDTRQNWWVNIPQHTIKKFLDASLGRWRIIGYCFGNWPLARYVKPWVAHAPGMLGAFSPPLTSKETVSFLSRHASRHVRHAVIHVGIANPRCRGKSSRYSWRMHNPQFYVSGKSSMLKLCKWTRPVGYNSIVICVQSRKKEHQIWLQLKGDDVVKPLCVPLSR